MIRRAAIVAAACVTMLLAACAAPADTSPPPPTRRTPAPALVTTGCADVVVLGLRGAGQSADKNHGAGQEILAAVRAMSTELHRRSGTTVRLEGIPYRAEYAPNAAYYRGNIDDGVRRTRSRIAELAGRCPESRIALVGFSQGAQAVHELAAGLTAASATRIALVAMIADPRRNPDDTIASWTYDEPAPGPGKLGPGPAIGSALADRAIAVCATGDEICNWPPGGHDGPLSETHRRFYETPAHARSTGTRFARILRSGGL